MGSHAEDLLLYRRQYILGPRFIDLPSWKHIKINDEILLTVHPDLEAIQTSNNGIQLTLLGFIVDPYHPDKSNQEIMEYMNKAARSFEDVIRETDHCGGRWIIIYNDGTKIKLFHDPCGGRQVYYSRQKDGIWCGSQSSTLAELLQVEVDLHESLQDFVASNQFEAEERSWPGDGSPYKEIKHLLSNHYLDVIRGTVTRYWPYERLEKMDLHTAVPVAAELLRGSIHSIAKRQKIMIPVTAGWESRALLAASRDIKNEVFYYIGRHSNLSKESTDISLPARLLPALGLTYNVLECTEEMDVAFKRVFNKNTMMARHLPKSLIIYYHYKHSQDYINLCGNGSEIAKKCVYTYHYSNKVNGALLAKINHYKNIEYPINIYGKWLQDSEAIAKEYNLNIFDLFYWEQRMGNWGAMYASEQDIAIDEFCPFNNRKLLTTLLSVDEKYRIPPNFTLYKEIVTYLWPKTLIEQVNPPNVKIRVRNTVKGLFRYIHNMSLKISKHLKLLIHHDQRR